MITFLVSIVVLIAAYFVYGKFVEKVFDPIEYRETPASRCFSRFDWIKNFFKQFYHQNKVGRELTQQSTLEKLSFYQTHSHSFNLNTLSLIRIYTENIHSNFSLSIV